MPWRIRLHRQRHDISADIPSFKPKWATCSSSPFRYRFSMPFYALIIFGGKWADTHDRRKTSFSWKFSIKFFQSLSQRKHQSRLQMSWWQNDAFHAIHWFWNTARHRLSCLLSIEEPTSSLWLLLRILRALRWYAGRLAPLRWKM